MFYSFLIESKFQCKGREQASVSSFVLLALLNRLKLVYELFEQSTKHLFLHRPARKELNVPKQKNTNVLLSQYIYTVNAGNYCTNICIESDLYCNGNIDMPNDSNSTIFVKNYSTINYTISDVLLYPDELYCSSRLHAVFMIAYVLTFVSFSFSIALVVRTRPLLHFLIRRRTKEIKMKKEMFECS